MEDFVFVCDYDNLFWSLIFCLGYLSGGVAAWFILLWRIYKIDYAMHLDFHSSAPENAKSVEDYIQCFVLDHAQGYLCLCMFWPAYFIHLVIQANLWRRSQETIIKISMRILRIGKQQSKKDSESAYR
jgi:hypothetical protein